MGHCGFTGSGTTILMALPDAVNRLGVNRPASERIAAPLFCVC